MLLARHLALDAVLVQQVYAHVEQLLVVGTLQGDQTHNVCVL